MEDPFAPIRPGSASPFMRSFSTVQKSLTLLKDLDRRSSDDQGAAVVKPLRSALRILIENQSGVDLNPGDIVQVNAAVTPFTGDDQYAFRDTPCYTGDIPAATTDLFAVLEEPAPAQDADGNFSYAYAVFMGHAVCDVDITDTSHGYATPTASDQTKLTSATSGPARILDRESTGTGLKKCGLKIDESGAASGFVGAAAKGTAPQSIANNTPTNISWDSSEFDTSSFWTAGDPTKLTVPESGYYHVGCSNYWQSGPTNYSAQILLSHSASVTFAFQGGIVPSDLIQSAQTVTGIIHASAGDYFVVTVTQLSGVNKNAKSYTTQYSRFWCYKIG